MSEITHAKITENSQIAQDIFDLRIYSPKQAALAAPGQFLGIYTGNGAMLLPRPLSICEIDAPGGHLRVVYRIVGGGTKEIAGMAPGGHLRILGPLGNGYAIDNTHRNFAIVGGGLGVPPLLGLAASIRKAVPDAKISVYLGFRDKAAVILQQDFGKFADEIIICTDDGSHGTHGNVIEAARGGDFEIAYGCGPPLMLKALAQYAGQANVPCHVSVEEHMACCVGTCLACAVKVRQEGVAVINKRACCDGPVFNAREVVW
ncbi:MAG: dihydroorotate dehydrogenase electron transfer subunit [Clostridiales bacterium]|jgi:dihydroorotate dehydrogenase electron transfer subunit|nr:dihydroorotate dehydrogenase electron transfer subunit [Clostridiales bacterium]